MALPLRMLALWLLTGSAFGSTYTLHDPTADQIVQSAQQESFWLGAWSKDYANDLWDEIRLKDDPGGFVPMITGEADRDFDHEVVADLVFTKMSVLPKYMDGAVAVVRLGSDHDQTVGADYVDSYYILDLTLFYAAFTQRMYRLPMNGQGHTVLPFELIDASMVGATTWAGYQKTIDATLEAADMRSAMFASVVEPSAVHGMFEVSPGTTHRSRVTMVSRITFGDDAGWVARMGSQMPGVLKAGLKSGFRACVAMATVEQQRRDAAAAAAPPPAPAPVDLAPDEAAAPAEALAPAE
jgi:hypothetical protein